MSERATLEGTRRYAESFRERAADGHFRETHGLIMSSLGIGTYLGQPDERTDAAYTEAIVAAVENGINVVDAAISALLEDAATSVASVATLIKNKPDILDPNIVKTVLDFDENALYFSRAPIPWLRDAAAKMEVRHLKHLGLYVFQRDALLEYPTLPQGTLEKIEQLEQLRWLENGWKIRIAEVEHDSVSVDVPEDVAKVEKLLQK